MFNETFAAVLARSLLGIAQARVREQYHITLRLANAVVDARQAEVAAHRQFHSAVTACNRARSVATKLRRLAEEDAALQQWHEARRGLHLAERRWQPQYDILTALRHVAAEQGGE